MYTLAWFAHYGRFPGMRVIPGEFTSNAKVSFSPKRIRLYVFYIIHFNHLSGELQMKNPAHLHLRNDSSKPARKL